MNTTITNQIIDFVIDNYTNLKSEQLEMLQKDLRKSQALYRFNENAFDIAIQDIKKQSEFKIEEETINDFAKTCIVMIEEHLNTDLSEEEQKNIEELLEKDSLWTRFLQNLNTKIDKNSVFVTVYDLSGNLFIKIILFIAIIAGLLYIMIHGKAKKVIYLICISLLAAFIHYLMLGIVYVMTPLLANLIHIDNLTIFMDPVLYLAIFWLVIALIFIYLYLKKESI